MTDTADVIIIGAGVHGTSLAFHLAERGTSVIVARASLDRRRRDRTLERPRADALRPPRRDEAGLGVVPVLHATGRSASAASAGSPTRASCGSSTATARRACGPTSTRTGRWGSTRRSFRRDDIARLAPAMALDGDEVAAYEPASGYADPSVIGDRVHAGREGHGRTAGAGRRGHVDHDQRRRHAGHRRRDDERRLRGADRGQRGGRRGRRGVGAMVGLDVPVTVWRHDTGYIGVPVAAARPIPVVIDNARSMYIRPEGGELAAHRARGRQHHRRVTRPRHRDRRARVPRRRHGPRSSARSRRSPTARSAPPTAARTA